MRATDTATVETCSELAGEIADILEPLGGLPELFGRLAAAVETDGRIEPLPETAIVAMSRSAVDHYRRGTFQGAADSCLDDVARLVDVCRAVEREPAAA